MNKLEWVFSRIFKSTNFKKQRKDRQLIVWGTGKYGEIFARLAQGLNLPILAYVDSNKNKQGNVFYGLKVVAPKIALEEYPNAKVILAMEDVKAISLVDKIKANYCHSVIKMADYLFDMCKDYSILEIGPLHNPFFTGENVKYLDVFSAEKLHDLAIYNHLPVDRVPKHIDYVSLDGSMEIVKKKFDYIYSSHLIEHQTDLIKHLQEVYDHLKPNGAYILAIPDKRYCFNYFDPCTTLEDVLSAYYEKRTRHSLSAVFRATHGTHNNAMLHWQGEHGCHESITKEKIKDGVKQYFVSLTGSYIDVHEWYFTPDVFGEIFRNLQKLDLVKYKEIETFDTEEGQNTFYVCIR